MTITIKYFQILRDLTGKSEETLDLVDGSTAGDGFSAVVERHPALAEFQDSVLLAIDQVWAKPDESLSDGCVLAIMPPVSGG